MVRIKPWSLPLSPTALRAALIRLVRVDSETIRPSQIFSNQIVLGDDAVAILDEKNEEVEHLRLDGNAFAATRQLAAVDVKYMIRKEKLHASIHV